MQAPVGAFLLFGPDLVEGIAVVEYAVLHDVADLAAVMDVVEGVFVEDDEIGDLADFDGADVFLDAESLCAHDGGGLEGFHVGEAACLESPEFKVGADALVVAVAAESDAATLMADCCIDDGLVHERRVDCIG